MADAVVKLVQQKAVVTLGGGELVALRAAQASMPYAVRAEAALAEIEDIASGAPDAPSILNKADKDGINVTPDTFKQGAKISVATLAATTALTPAVTRSIQIESRTALGDGYAGTFQWISGDQSANVTADTENGVWIAPSSDVTGASGAWKRVFDYEVNVRWFNAKGDGVTDDRAAIIVGNAVADLLNRDLFFPEGGYRVTDKVVKSPNVGWRGVDRDNSYIYADARSGGFNLSATAIVEYAASENANGITDLGIRAYQDPNTPDRASLINYPRMLDVRGCPRFYLDRVRLWGGKVGLDATGNAGGAYISRIEVGCTDVGVDMDGPLDFMHGDSFHDWLFVGSDSGTPLGAIMRDGQRIAVRLGKVDGLSISKLATFLGRIVVTGAETSNIPIQITALQLDGDKATLEVSNYDVQIALGYTTKTSAATVKAVAISGTGRVNIGNIQGINGGTTVPMMSVAESGFLAIGGGRLTAASNDGKLIEQTGGTCILRNTHISLVSDTARTVAAITSTGGTLIAQNNSASTTSGSGGGPIISIGTDSANHNISGNNFRGWTISLPANPRLGCYGPNNIAASTFTPAVTFATVGNFVPTYASREGKYWFTGEGIRFELSMAFNTNAYTTASGNFLINGLPVSITAASIVNPPTEVGQWGGMTLTAGKTQLAARQRVAENGIQLVECGSASAAATLTTAAFPASTNGFNFILAGFIPRA